jgi:hypothetical protein
MIFVYGSGDVLFDFVSGSRDVLFDFVLIILKLNAWKDETVRLKKKIEDSEGSAANTSSKTDDAHALLQVFVRQRVCDALFQTPLF